MSDKRLIEDFLPIEDISAEASREKSVRKGHISTLHLWWARRPLVACRAAVYGALVPASRFVPPACRDDEGGAGRENGYRGNGKSLGRANAAKFIERLCKYPGNPTVIREAQRHILEAHAERLNREGGTGVSPVTVDDIEAGKEPRPKVLDMFAGGGAIPLEALRLGCESYALDLNPVAHIIELCTLVYPQKYGKPDPNARGMTGKPQAGSLSHQTTWGGLAQEVRYWGEWVLKKVKAEIGDLYPLIPDSDYRKKVGKIGGTGFQPVEQDLFITRRNLPHWQLGGATYFVTFRTQALGLTPEARAIVLDACRHFDGNRYHLWTAVVMPDHAHLLLQPKEIGKNEWHSLSSILHSIKSFTAKKINALMSRTGTVWQDESFDRIVRDENEFLEKWNYIRNNPVKRELVHSPTEWIGFYECTGRMPVPPDSSQEKIPPGYLVPVAYLWTRTVRCKNPSCGATVPLVRQTWLCKKKGRYVALKMVAQASSLSRHSQDGCATKKVRFEVVESNTEAGLGFDPAGFSKGGNATCPFCGTVADTGYVKAEGQAGRLSHHQLMAVVCTRPGRQGKVYLSGEEASRLLESVGTTSVPPEEEIQRRIEALCTRTGLTVPSESIANLPSDSRENTLGISVRPYGIRTWGDLFTPPPPRQMLCLLTFAAVVREAYQEMVGQATGLSSTNEERAKAVATYLGVLVNRLADYGSAFCRWIGQTEAVADTFARHALAMLWDFAELCPFGLAGSNAQSILNSQIDAVRSIDVSTSPAWVWRGSATALSTELRDLDAVITDPPYYDNIQYAALSDFFYVWIRRTIGHLYSEHVSTELSPKKNEAVASPWRHKSKLESRRAYEQMMAKSFSEANRVLKPGGQMTVVYAHKTTLGWSTLVYALRRAGFTVTEAWPLDTERPGRLREHSSAALASSIFLVARKREGASTGSYEDEVRPELEKIVRERVDSLWKMGITGADLVITAVGEGLRAFTRFSRVEYANGEEVPAEKFMAEVEGVVLETLLEKIFMGQAASLSSSRPSQASGLSHVDGPTRFYVLWRYTYGAAEMDAGEAIVFTYGQNVELEGPNGLTGRRPVPLLEKKKGKYRLRDFAERGNDEKLGLPNTTGGTPVLPPLIDVLHRILWLVENEPRNLNSFLDEARPDRERLRLVAQTVAGTALEGGQASGLSGDGRDARHPTLATTPTEAAALKKLVANWRALIESRLSDVDTKIGQRKLFS